MLVYVGAEVGFLIPNPRKRCQAWIEPGVSLGDGVHP